MFSFLKKRLISIFFLSLVILHGGAHAFSFHIHPVALKRPSDKVSILKYTLLGTFAFISFKYIIPWVRYRLRLKARPTLIEDFEKEIVNELFEGPRLSILKDFLYLKSKELQQSFSSRDILQAVVKGEGSCWNSSFMQGQDVFSYLKDRYKFLENFSPDYWYFANLKKLSYLVENENTSLWFDRNGIYKALFEMFKERVKKEQFDPKRDGYFLQEVWEKLREARKATAGIDDLSAENCFCSHFVKYFDKWDVQGLDFDSLKNKRVIDKNFLDALSKNENRKFLNLAQLNTLYMYACEKKLSLGVLQERYEELIKQTLINRYSPDFRLLSEVPLDLFKKIFNSLSLEEQAQFKPNGGINTFYFTVPQEKFIQEKVDPLIKDQSSFEENKAKVNSPKNTRENKFKELSEKLPMREKRSKKNSCEKKETKAKTHEQKHREKSPAKKVKHLAKEKTWDDYKEILKETYKAIDKDTMAHIFNIYHKEEERKKKKEMGELILKKIQDILLDNEDYITRFNIEEQKIFYDLMWEGRKEYILDDSQINYLLTQIPPEFLSTWGKEKYKEWIAKAIKGPFHSDEKGKECFKHINYSFLKNEKIKEEFYSALNDENYKYIPDEKLATICAFIEQDPYYQYSFLKFLDVDEEEDRKEFERWKDALEQVYKKTQDKDEWIENFLCSFSYDEEKYTTDFYIYLMEKSIPNEIFLKWQDNPRKVWNLNFSAESYLTFNHLKYLTPDQIKEWLKSDIPQGFGRRSWFGSKEEQKNAWEFTEYQQKAFFEKFGFKFIYYFEGVPPEVKDRWLKWAADKESEKKNSNKEQDGYKEEEYVHDDEIFLEDLLGVFDIKQKDSYEKYIKEKRALSFLLHPDKIGNLIGGHCRKEKVNKFAGFISRFNFEVKDEKKFNNHTKMISRFGFKRGGFLKILKEIFEVQKNPYEQKMIPDNMKDELKEFLTELESVLNAIHDEIIKHREEIWPSTR